MPETRPAYRFNRVQTIKAERSHVTGQNPPYGADINFFVPGAAGAEADDDEGTGTAGAAVVRILGPAGDTIRTPRTGAAPGVNRVWWDLRSEPTRRAKIRTAPPGLPWVPLGPEGWRPLRTWDLDLNQGQLGPRAVPGDYQVVLEIGGTTLSTPLTVLKDPHSEGTLTDIREQVALSMVIRDEINEVVDMIDRIEWAHGRLSALSQDIGSSSADFPPTVPQVEVHDVLRQRLDATRLLFGKLFTEDAEELNRMLRERRLPVVISQ